MKIHRTDKEYLPLIREHINAMLRLADRYSRSAYTVLEIGPGKYGGVQKYFPGLVIKTLDINPDSGADFIGDICSVGNVPTGVPSYFGAVVCTEVLNYMRDPKSAMKNIYDSLTRDGTLYLSAPLNFKASHEIHAPDYWRFTEPGLRLLLKDFEIIEFDALESDRGGFPIHYNVIARKK